MAPPHRWFDLLVDARWHTVLTKTELQLLLAVGRRVDRTSRTRIKLDRLREESGLDRTTFFRAKTALIRYSLLNRAKLDGRWIITLPLPPVASANHGPRSQRTTDQKVSSLRTKKYANHGPADGQKPPQTRKTAAAQQKTQAQLEGQAQGQEPAGLRDYLQGKGVPEAFVPDFLDALRIVQALPATDGVRPSAVADASWTLGLKLQAHGVLISAAQVEVLFGDALALVNPLVQAAVKIFDAEILEVVAPGGTDG
jgi:hypothetical protein